jgi:hypothetical protein
MNAILLALGFTAIAQAQPTVSVEAYGRDETDGSDVGWNSGYPSPSFDDDANRRGLPNAVWDGSYRLEANRVCLQVRNLRSPYPPQHTLALGYRVRLGGAVFEDGSSERLVVMHRFSGAPSPTSFEQCVGIRAGGAPGNPPPPVPPPAGGGSGPIVLPSVGPPTAGLSGGSCHGLWGLGVQLGFAEHAATYDDRPQLLVQSLTYARDLAAQSGCLPTDEIEALRQRMASASSSRPLFDAINGLRIRFASIVQAQCTCRTGGGQAAHGVWGTGVQMGYAEYGSGRNMSVATLRETFRFMNDLATSSRCLPTTEIRRIQRRVGRATQSAPHYQEILRMRLRYATIVQQRCGCGAAGAAPAAAAVCTPACRRGHVCVNGTCVGTGDLRFTLTWNQPGDMDLHVLTPGGHDIHYASRQHDEGELDHDDTSGTGPENVFWDDDPPAGTYLVCVTPYRIDGARSFTLTVNRTGRQVQTFTGTRTTSSGNRTCARGSPDFVTEVQIP